MTKKHSTKRALLMSMLSLLLCVSMLIGTTYAWFTDSVTSANNVIKSGNLDIVLEYYDTESKTWKDVENASDILSGDLWEPGYVDVAYLRLKNAGSLALKYQLAVNILSEKSGVNAAGEEFLLSDYIEFGIVDGVDTPFATRADAMKEVTASKKISEGFFKGETLLPKTEFVYFAMVVFMPESVNNVANHNGTDVPQIDLGINVFATQHTYEKDSYDELYDKYTAVFTVAEANAMMKEGKDVTLVNCKEPESVVEIPAGYNGTLVLNNVTVASVMQMDAVSTFAATGTATVRAANVVILGDVVVKATEEGQSAVTGTALNLSGNGKLTAVGKGKAAFGIGGMNTQSITIKDLTVAYAEGGEAYGVGSDTKYYKDAPEGGAAIGSGLNGAEIVLNNVTVEKAVGGSKAAGIGARYHVGVNVTVTDSTVYYVEGGVSAAGIGGSRISGDGNENGTKITISNSVINAKGGAFGAGIGSGYDTHCLSKQPLCEINITDSSIKATGGRYAAGIGSGYHNAALKGEIKGGQVQAVSGEKVYKASYTAAMDIGFGVVDPTREGTQTDSYLNYDGDKITIATAPKSALTSEDLNNALVSGANKIALGKGTFVIPDSAKGKTLTLMGSGKDTVVAAQDDGASEGDCDYSFDGSTVTFENLTITTTATYFPGYARMKGIYNNCTINGVYTLYDDGIFNDCTFNISGDFYNVWTWGATEAIFNQCTFNSDGKAILLYGTANTNLTLNHCTFNDKGGLSDKKAAVEIGNDYGKTYTLTVNSTVVNGYEINDKGINTGSTLWANKNSMGKDKLNVVIDGVDVY